MTKKEMLKVAQRNLNKAAAHRIDGNKVMYEVYVASAKLWIREVQKRIYQEKLNKMVTAFPKHVMHESIMLSPIPNRFMFEATNINWSI